MNTFTTHKAKEQHTKIIYLENKTFFRHKIIVPHNSPYIGLADYVSIMFVDQKNSRKYDTVTMHKTNHPLLNSIQAWTHSVRHIMSYPGFYSSWPVNTWFIGIEKRRTTPTAILQDLRPEFHQFGKENLGFDVSDVKTHSIRSSCVMLIYLNNVSVFIIILVSTWSLEAFLIYIQK